MLANRLPITILSLLALKTGVARTAIVHEYQSGQSIIDNQIHYEYRYAIEDPISGVISEKWESRLGDYVKGRYSFLQADGLVQTVHYESDNKLGYRAVVQTTKPEFKFEQTYYV